MPEGNKRTIRTLITHDLPIIKEDPEIGATVIEALPMEYVRRVSLKGTIGAYKRDYTKNNCQDSNKTFDEEDSINT